MPSRSTPPLPSPPRPYLLHRDHIELGGGSEEVGAENRVTDGLLPNIVQDGPEGTLDLPYLGLEGRDTGYAQATRTPPPLQHG